MSRSCDTRNGVESQSPRGRELAAARAYLKLQQSEPDSVLDRVADAILSEITGNAARFSGRLAATRPHRRRQRGVKPASRVKSRD